MIDDLERYALLKCLLDTAWREGFAYVTVSRSAVFFAYTDEEIHACIGRRNIDEMKRYEERVQRVMVQFPTLMPPRHISRQRALSNGVFEWTNIKPNMLPTGKYTRTP